MIRVNEELLPLLRQCLQSNRPDLLWILDTDDYIYIDQDLGNELREAILVEFIRIGLDSDDNPNEIGIKLEELIDEIGDMFM
ncbi:hypothetical protein [Bacillus sp. Hm123]|uniref:hypothetical protein n=1 Tax=Bacillus sp. Hm123 TaxID=3450745 RepID=UPI003F432FDB